MSSTQHRLPLASFLERVYPLFICLFCLFNFYLAYPGSMSPDPYWQLHQALTQNYDDWHPPIMAWWWGVLYRNLWSNQAVLLLFHLLLLWGAVYTLGRILMHNSIVLAYLCPFVLVIPPLFSMTLVLWKDTGLACSWFLASAIMARHCYEKRPLGFLSATGVMLLLFYGTAVRYNAITAVLPLCFWFIICPGTSKGTWKRDVLLAFALSMFLWGCTEVVRSSLAKTNHARDFRAFRYDFDVVSQQVHEEIYTRDGSTSPVRSYIYMITHYPAEWLSYRTKIFAELLRIGYDQSCEPYWWNPSPSLLRNFAKNYLEAEKQGFWFFGYNWLMLSLGLLIVALKYIRIQQSIVISAILWNLSGLMYLLPQFFFSPACDFRFLYWMIVSTVAAAILLIYAFYGWKRPDILV